ncbi:type 1 fimbrial protein [Photorhabdus sp. UCH-936]|nr:type 1 fimbrial protein [Photorhabdus antumapuensis]
MKKILKISVVAALVLGVVSAASADSAGGPVTPTPKAGQVKKNALVTISGSVVAATCDVSSSSADAKVDLGNVSRAAFKKGSPVANQIGIGSYVSDFSKPITISLSNCDDDNTDANKVKLHVTGSVVGGSNNAIFNHNEKAKNVGALLTYKDGSDTKIVVNDGDVLLKGGAASGAKGKDFDGYSVTFTAHMASTIAEPESGQDIYAPITFSYAYN